MAGNFAGLAVVAHSLSAIKHAKVKVIRNEQGLAVDYSIEGEYPKYGNNDDRADSLAIELVQSFMNPIRQHKTYRGAVATQSVLTITSNVVYGKKTGSTRDGRKAASPLLPVLIRCTAEIPPTSGTGLEVTPFAVVTDERSGIKYPNSKWRYARIADYLNLGGDTEEKKVQKSIAAVEDLKRQVDIPSTIFEAIASQGMSDDFFFARVEEIADRAFDDPCTGSNPGYRLIEDLKQLLQQAYSRGDTSFVDRVLTVV